VAQGQDLEQLSSKELHDRAMKMARHHLDVGFLWSVLKAIPAAEAAAGDVEEAEEHVVVGNIIDIIEDLVHLDEGELGDALRPLYIDYLRKHEGQ
jgi:hypothetical protein